MRAAWLVLPVLVAVGALGACDGLRYQTDCTEDPFICGDPDGGNGVEGGGRDVVVPEGCDLTKSPKESPECVSDDVGVFVSPTGKDGAAGTKADPLKSIAEAVGRGLPRVYVCEGSYEVPVVITAPVAIFGGLSCAWASSEVHPVLAPPKGIAVKVANVQEAVLLEDVDVVGSADPDLPGDSAIGAFVIESKDVTFRRVSLTAGPGTSGAKGETASNYTADAAAGKKANLGAGGDPVACTCADGSSSTGGRGGSVAPTEQSPSRGTANPPVGTSNGGNNGEENCVAGTNGASGLAAAGGAGSTAPGTLTAEGWDTSQVGGSGEAGRPGQGGGGGGGRLDVLAGGGGGACGGCGGAGGKPGMNGGSSFALLSFESTITVDGGKLLTAAGGQGGEGGGGQNGQGGGGPGVGASCNGGSGGAGAGGSGGGGGAGGHSVPVAFGGPEPKVNGATLRPGAKGAPGQGGQKGNGAGNAGAVGNPGAEGKSQKTLAL